MKTTFTFLLSILMLLPCAAQNSPQFTKEQLLSDLDFLKEKLVETHIDLFAYTSKQELSFTYEQIRSEIKQDSISLLQATNLLQRYVAKVNNGHTNIDFPVQTYSDYAYSEGTLFPLEVAFDKDRVLVRKNWSENTRIKPGTQLLSINGKSIEDVLAKIYPQLAAERLYFKRAKVELYSLPRLYWQLFGQVDEFSVEVKTDGIIQTIKLNAIKALDDFEMKRQEVINTEMKLEFLNNAAYLRPGNLSGDLSKFERFIDSAFVQIKERESKNLIIDLRNNGGGDDPFSDYLISYIADKPFKWCSSFRLKTSEPLKEHTRKNSDTTSALFKEVLSRKSGEVYTYDFDWYQPQPVQNRFKGQVYVLVNRQSHSQAAVASAQIQDCGFGRIVGEETAEYPSLLASVFRFTLPNTGIVVGVSKGQIVRVNGILERQGVIPDTVIKDHLLDDNDEILEGLLARITKEKF